MSVFVVGGLAIAVEAPAAVGRALLARYGAFSDESHRPAAFLRVATGEGFVADYRLDEPSAALRVQASRSGARVLLDGGARGWFDPGSGNGVLDDATHLGEVDAIFRLALALLLPRRGALLVHGAAVPMPSGPVNGRVAVLVGASGAGKSTAAAALGPGLGDELVVLHAAEAGVEASGTPYWHGQPARLPVAIVGCLERGRSVGAEPLHGGAALRALMPHVVRYLVDAEADRAIFSCAASVAGRVPMVRLACPEGPAFVPFLRDTLVEANLR